MLKLNQDWAGVFNVSLSGLFLQTASLPSSSSQPWVWWRWQPLQSQVQRDVAWAVWLLTHEDLQPCRPWDMLICLPSNRAPFAWADATALNIQREICVCDTPESTLQATAVGLKQAIVTVDQTALPRTNLLALPVQTCFSTEHVHYSITASSIFQAAHLFST